MSETGQAELLHEQTGPLHTAACNSDLTPWADGEQIVRGGEVVGRWAVLGADCTLIGTSLTLVSTNCTGQH